MLYTQVKTLVFGLWQSLQDNPYIYEEGQSLPVD